MGWILNYISRCGMISCRTELGISPETFVIGIVASLYAIKDHATLIRAFGELRKTNPNSRLLIVGEGEERKRLESIAPEGVLFFGNRRDVPRILNMLDVYVLCSLNEGISNTILEAMSTGLPVIASNVGGNPDLVLDGTTGRLFPSGDAGALQDLLLRYMASPDERRNHGQRGRETVLANYGIKAMVNAYEEVWRRVSQATTA